MGRQRRRSGTRSRRGCGLRTTRARGRCCCGRFRPWFFLLRKSFERILFLLEQAHWFYEDNSVEHNPNLKSLSFKDFTSLMFKSRTALRPYIAHLDDIYKDFNNYKFRVPVSGAIILDDTYERCLLVKGWKARASWSFPRGKRNKDEEDHTCAVREVLEETGCDVSRLLNLDEYIEFSIGQQRVRLYIITGVKRDTVFAPQTKKEISEISWHRIDDLLPAAGARALYILL
ncbi:mRNA-decapping enzyme subunit 2 [Zea mays]|uniref:mRNA-decapping enzyme subunit 2 n=2 Tax=Zea mays TaxID=4577 RepID=A0A3L6EAY3_MAIZE|nr:mRNA-decapping enzyme subunit 2 [Zea mays]PWZ17885.1 mRNA-decapping enzyme subunit 2 [Zea mays]